jgi:hypothetical protein
LRLFNLAIFALTVAAAFGIQYDIGHQEWIRLWFQHGNGGRECLGNAILFLSDEPLATHENLCLGKTDKIMLYLYECVAYDKM